MELIDTFDHERAAREILVRIERIEQKIDWILETRGGYEAKGTPSTTVEQEVLELLRDGHKFEAIAHYRKATGVELDDAMDRVEALWTRRD